MGRMYTVVFSAVAVTAAQDLFEIAPATNKPCVIHALYLAQGTEIKDAEEEMLQIVIERGHSTSGSGGTTPTPTPLDSIDAAAGFTAEVNNTTKAQTGTIVTLHSDYWNVRIPYVWIPTPEMRPTVSAAANRLTVELVAAPTDSITMSGTLYVEELS